MTFLKGNGWHIKQFVAVKLGRESGMLPARMCNRSPADFLQLFLSNHSMALLVASSKKNFRYETVKKSQKLA